MGVGCSGRQQKVALQKVIMKSLSQKSIAAAFLWEKWEMPPKLDRKPVGGVRGLILFNLVIVYTARGSVVGSHWAWCVGHGRIFSLPPPDFVFQIDCTKHRCVDESEGRLWAESKGFLYFETSAQTGEGISEMFQVSRHPDLAMPVYS